MSVIAASKLSDKLFGMARFQRSTLINANRFVAAQTYTLKAATKTAKKQLRQRKIRAALKRKGAM